MGSIFLFPAVAVFLRRHPPMLWVTTGIGVWLILWFAAFAASVPKDAIPAEYGYSLPLQRSLLTYGLRLGLPQIAATERAGGQRELALHSWRSFRHGRLPSGRPTRHTRCVL